ncbi:RNA 2'-phosphotransferase [Psychroserpens algicola]|uniref:Probable RNA 2'-phosphotransferase n=1 Tax=Psychroserpens algicola TaxID=1719034 RepID=A0ABT0H7U5_9FLAO|nr:RNA 2'-phosphotransferase [Psychroserpens algicola]MCK8480436.1 RNA 2'-phosphotransferase [Psychroserpens algicola]
MTDKDKKHISKFLSLVLRHRPEYIGLPLNTNGWANVDELIEKSRTRHMNFSSEELAEVVATNDKQRFAFNDDKSMIRANQGHSVKTIDLQLEAIKPPEFLYHGTVEKFISSIQQSGLQKRSRQHVHLSEDLETATKVGSRRGEAIILKIDSGTMFKNGFTFYRSENNVWLTNHVPVEFIEFK